MNRSNKSAPLMVWAMTLGFVILMAAGTLYLYFQTKPFIEFNSDRLAAFKDVKGKKVAGIGSSLMYNATYFDDFMSDFCLKNGYESIRFLRIVRYGSSIEDFFQLLNPILDASPDVILIESNLLFFNRGERRLPSAAADFKKFLKFLIRYPERINDFQRGERGNLELMMELPFQSPKQDTVERLQRAAKLKKMQVRNPDELKELSVFFSMCKERQIKVVIVEIPGFLENGMAEWSLKKQKIASLCQALETEYGTEYLTFPYQFGLEYYRDFAHFNQKGRESYSRWLVKCLSEY